MFTLDFNSFAPGNFAEKRVLILKLVERFSSPCLAIKKLKLTSKLFNLQVVHFVVF